MAGQVLEPLSYRKVEKERNLVPASENSFK